MKIERSFQGRKSLTVALLALLGSAMVWAQSSEAPPATQAKATSDLPSLGSAEASAEESLANLRLAEDLLRFAESRKDSLAAVLAARILVESPGGYITGLPQGGDPSTFTQMSKADFGKLTNEEGAKAARTRIDQALALAEAESKGDENIKGLIDSVRSTNFQYGVTTCYAYNNLGAYFWWTGPSPGIARSNAMRACRSNTPYGYSCFLSHCE